MDPIIYINCKSRDFYNTYTIWSRIKDRFKIKLNEKIYIDELSLTINNINIPPNLNKCSYFKNVNACRKYSKSREKIIVPKIFRNYDFNYYNDFQKRLFAFSVKESIKLILRVNKKSLKNSCIVIYDACNDLNKIIINEIAKECKFIILISKQNKKLENIRDYIINEYGVSPVITFDYNYAFNKADFIITSQKLNINNKNIWYLNNLDNNENKDNLSINDVDFFIPWTDISIVPSIELVGAILAQMEERDIEKSLKYNGIFINNIKYNEYII